MHLTMHPGERLRTKLSAINDSKPSWLKHMLRKLLTRKMSAVGDLLPMLPGRKPAENGRKEEYSQQLA